MRFIAERAAVDYIAYTTWKPGLFEQIMSSTLTEEEILESEDAKIPRYRGRRFTDETGSRFYGRGTQMDAVHHVINVSGGMADKFALYLAGQPALGNGKVSRIDFQLTIEKPEWYVARDFVDRLQKMEWKGKKRKLMLIENGGMDTVYIGSRQSDRFIRLYVKEDSWLRFEVEYKASRAKAAFIRYSEVPELAASGIVASELHGLPMSPIVKYFADYLVDYTRMPVKPEKAVVGHSSRYAWFQVQVLPALDKLLNDHDFRRRVQRDLNDLLARFEVEDMEGSE